jgi:hypothetical protein
MFVIADFYAVFLREFVGFEVLTAVSMKMAVFWVVAASIIRAISP